VEAKVTSRGALAVLLQGDGAKNLQGAEGEVKTTLKDKGNTIKFVFHYDIANIRIPMKGTLVQMGGTSYTIKAEGMAVEVDFELDEVKKGGDSMYVCCAMLA